MSKITIDRALLEQALEALSYCEPDCEENTHGFDLWANVLPPLREALAQQQPVQEPFGFMNAGQVHEMQQGRLPYGYVYPKGGAGASFAVYTSPQAQPAQPAQPPSDEQIADAYEATVSIQNHLTWAAYHAGARFAETQHSITKGTT